METEKNHVPSPQETREEIERIKDKEVKMFCKTAYIVGAAKACEIAGTNCKKEKAYGPKGTDVELLLFQPQTIAITQIARIIAELTKSAEKNEVINKEHLNIFNQALASTEIAVFKIANSQKRLKPVSFRKIALPMEKRFEEWTHEIFEYYNQREKTLVFPHNRKHYLDYLKYNGVFKNWCYPTESYTQTENIGKVSIETIREIGSSPLTNYSFNDEGDTIKYETKLEHLKPFMLNGLRWSRMFELVKVFKFTPLELSIFVGWGEKTPTRALKKFASIYEQEQHKSRIYESYLPKLMIEG